MASKFQNRMAGTIILVAIGVIILPGLLDGKKKHYKEEFAAIPLVPKPGDQQDNDLVPPVTQPLSGTPASRPVSSVPGITTATPNTEADDQQSSDEATATAKSSAARTEVAPAQNSVTSSNSAAAAREKQQQAAAAAAREKQAQLAQQRQAEREARAEQQASDAAAAKAKAQQAKEERERQRALQALNGGSSAPAAQPAATARQEAPTGQAWVIQLGALKNASRVTEIVTQLRSAGFRAYSLPSQPVQGQINRILVGPDSSKSALQAQVAELKSKTGLSGVVRPYSAR